MVWGPGVLLAAVQASRKETRPSGPGRSATWRAPPKSETSLRVVTVTVWPPANVALTKEASARSGATLEYIDPPLSPSRARDGARLPNERQQDNQECGTRKNPQTTRAQDANDGHPNGGLD